MQKELAKPIKTKQKNSTNNDVIAGIDVGGTKIAVALENKSRERIISRSFPTQVELGPAEILKNILENIDRMLDESRSELKAVGVCTPGPIDIQKGLVLSPSNFRDWVEFPIVRIIGERFGVPVVFDNDANAAALGEFFDGVGRKFETILYVTISTGIGGAIIFSGKIYHGTAASAGEIGHTIVQPQGALCGCGTRGCLETISSGLSIARRAKEIVRLNGGKLIGVDVDDITAKTVIEAVRREDKIALSVWDETVRYLAIGIGNAITTIAPEAVIIGGGISQAGDVLFKPLQAYLKQNVSMLPIDDVKILPAALGANSGICGALILARRAIDEIRDN